MILKLVKLFFLTIITSLVGYYVVRTQPSHNPEVSKDLKSHDATRNIKYQKRLGEGLLILEAAEVKIKSTKKILLSGIHATHKRNNKKVTIESRECEINIDLQKAFLRKSVIMRSSDITCKTSEATVDFRNNAIFGNSPITGRKSGSSFSASGFAINRDGIIKLKKATFKRVK